MSTFVELWMKFTDRLFDIIEHRYSENILVLMFFACVAVMVYCTHVHNDELDRWAQQVASNDLSALFGMLVGKSQAQSGK